MRRNKSSRTRLPRAFTMIELLIAASVTAMTLMAGATMISAVSNAALQTKDTRALMKAGQLTTDRISSLIRQTRGVGQVTASTVTLWDYDVNGDEIVNLHETSVLIYRSDTQQVVRRVTTPVAEGDVGPPVNTSAYQNSAGWEGIATGYSPYDIVLATGIEEFEFSGFPDLTETRLIAFSLKVTGETESMVFRESATPRATTDYLFNTDTHEDPEETGKPSRRTEYSRWTGWADVDGTAIKYPE